MGENILLLPPLPAYSLARSFCPGLRAMYQICLYPPGTATASPMTSQESPSPATGQTEAIQEWVFCLLWPQE